MKKIILNGTVGAMPQERYNSQSGEKFVTFTIAVNSFGKKSEKTDWIDIVCNGKLAETSIKWINKGRKLLIEGSPTVHAYINKENKASGVLRVYATSIEYLDRNKETNESYSGAGTYDTAEQYSFNSSASLTSDDFDMSKIPF